MKPRFNRLARKHIIGRGGLAPQYCTSPYPWVADEDFEEMRQFLRYPKMTLEAYQRTRGPTSGRVSGSGFVVPIRVKPSVVREWCAAEGRAFDENGLGIYLQAALAPDFPARFRAAFPAAAPQH